MNITFFSKFWSFFLDNINLKQTILKNTFWLVMAEIIIRILKLVVVIYVARILGATEYGKFTFALSFAMLFVALSDLGLSPITVREFSGSQDKENEFLSLISLKVLLGLATATLISSLSFFITADPATRIAILILSVYVAISGFSEILYAFFRARQQMQYESIAKIFQAIAISVLGFVVIFKVPSIQNLSYSYSLASLCALLLIMFFFFLLNRRIFPLKISFKLAIWKKYLKMSWPLALAGVFTAIYYNLNSTIMGYLGQITQTGWYNAAHKIIIATFIPADLLSIIFFPVLSVAFKESKEKFQKIWNYFNFSMIFLAIPIMAGGIALAPKIINIVFGENYVSAILAFQILIVTTVIYLMSAPLVKTLLVIHRQKNILWAYFAGAVTNVLLNFILIPKYSLYGASFSTVTTFFVIFVSLLIMAIKFSPLRLFDFEMLMNSVCVVMAGVIMYFVISNDIIYNLNLIAVIAIGALVYIISLTIFYLCKYRIFKNIGRSGNFSTFI